MGIMRIDGALTNGCVGIGLLQDFAQGFAEGCFARAREVAVDKRDVHMAGCLGQRLHAYMGSKRGP